MISLRMLPALKLKNASKNMTKRFSPSLTPERFFNKQLNAIYFAYLASTNTPLS